MSPRTHTLLCLSGAFGLPFLIAGCVDSVVEESATTTPTAVATTEATPAVTAMVDKLVVAEDGTISHESVDFIEAIASKDGVVLVDFWATWCGPCLRLAPELEKLAADHAGAVTIIKVDVDQAQQLAQEYQVSSIPDVRVFKGGEQIDALVGYMEADKISAQLGL